MYTRENYFHKIIQKSFIISLSQKLFKIIEEIEKQNMENKTK